jgi:hypothetical protein
MYLTSSSRTTAAEAESGAVPPSPRQPPPTDFAMAAAHLEMVHIVKGSAPHLQEQCGCCEEELVAEQWGTTLESLVLFFLFSLLVLFFFDGCCALGDPFLLPLSFHAL